MEYYVSIGVSIVTTVIAILSMQLKNMKWVLVCQISANLLAGISYILLGGFSGAAVSMIAVLQSFIMFFYNKKSQMPPVWFTTLFIALFVGCSVLSSTTYSSIMTAAEAGTLDRAFVVELASRFTTYIDLFPAAATVCFALAVAQKDSSKYRFWGLLNPILWLLFDFYVKAPVNFLMHFGIFISSLTAVIRLDLIPKLRGEKEAALIKKKYM